MNRINLRYFLLFLFSPESVSISFAYSLLLLLLMVSFFLAFVVSPDTLNKINWLRIVIVVVCTWCVNNVLTVFWLTIFWIFRCSCFIVNDLVRFYFYTNFGLFIYLFQPSLSSTNVINAVTVTVAVVVVCLSEYICILI